MKMCFLTCFTDCIFVRFVYNSFNKLKMLVDVFNFTHLVHQPEDEVMTYEIKYFITFDKKNCTAIICSILKI